MAFPLPTMAEHKCIRATGIFESIRQDGHIVKRFLFVDAGGYFGNRRGLPYTRCGRWLQRIAENIAEECAFFFAVRKILRRRYDLFERHLRIAAYLKRKLMLTLTTPKTGRG